MAILHRLQPFFVYYVPGGSHSPHQPTKEWIDKFKGKLDMGWNVMREQIFANLKRLGVIPANAQLTPWPDDLAKWDTLSADGTPNQYTAYNGILEVPVAEQLLLILEPDQPFEGLIQISSAPMREALARLGQ